MPVQPDRIGAAIRGARFRGIPGDLIEVCG
jgi:hypothetical protein